MTFDISLMGIKACIIASLYPFFLLLPGKKIQYIVTLLFIVIGILLQSRTLTLVTLLAFVYTQRQWLQKIKTAWWYAALVLIAIATVLIKFNSAAGRFFIWSTTIKNLHQVPWNGFGYGTFKEHYAQWQANYFATHTHFSKFHLLAEAPAFAFNEWLHLFVEYGLIAPLVLTILVVLHIRWLRIKKTPLQQALLLSNCSIFFFALFSYSFQSIWVLWILLANHILLLLLHYKVSIKWGVIIVLSMVPIFISAYRWKQNISWWQEAQMMPPNTPDKKAHYQQVLPALQHNAYFVHDYGTYLLDTQQPDSAISLAHTNHRWFNQYEHHLLLADAYVQQQRYDSAAFYFSLAHYTVPNRLLPLYNLMQIAITLNNKATAQRYAIQIMNTPIKIESPLAKRYKNEASIYLNSLQIPND